MANHRAERRSHRRGSSATPTPRRASGGKRRAVKDPAPRGALLRALPSTPVLAGVAALAISTGGAVTAADAGPVGSVSLPSAAQLGQANAVSGASSIARVSSLKERRAAVSRDSRRDALEDAADDSLLAQAEAQATQRDAALAKFAKDIEKHAAHVAENTWVLPVSRYRLTNTFGMARSYYSSGYHTGLDFAAPSGTPIMSVANGVVTEVGYDGSYGNKVVVTLEDGTELWYAHMSAFGTKVGETVRSGEVIGYVGSTGNSTGPHVHLEVRPGAGDPVDPRQALIVNGVTP